MTQRVPDQVILCGSKSQWTETHYGQGDRRTCPSGCANRDLADERRRGLDRLCLRCMTWTWDEPNWKHPGPAKPRGEADDAEG